jgi:putative transposase
MPEYGAIHSRVLQDVLARLDKTYQAFFRRMQAGERAGFPRYQGRDRYHSFTYKGFGNGAAVDNGFLVPPDRRNDQKGHDQPRSACWHVCFSCARVPIQPFPATGQETGVNLGIEAFATLSSGTRIFSPG